MIGDDLNLSLLQKLTFTGFVQRDFRDEICCECFSKKERGHRRKCSVGVAEDYIDEVRCRIALRIEYGA